VERTALDSVETPVATSTWQPIPHLRLVEQVELALKSCRLQIVNQAHCLSEGGSRYFGLMHIRNGREESDYAWVLGLRNSHDKTFPAGIVAGTQVFVCDNLSFGGEVKFARKHTRFIQRDLPILVARAIGRLVDKWHTQEYRIAAYKDRLLHDSEVHDLLVRALLIGAIGSRTMLPVLNQWRNPAHNDFTPRTVWSLFNAFTEKLKGDNLMALPKRTEALHLLLDRHVGLTDKEAPCAELAVVGE
jgi:hypothetical protein